MSKAVKTTTNGNASLLLIVVICATTGSSICEQNGIGKLQKHPGRRSDEPFEAVHIAAIDEYNEPLSRRSPKCREFLAGKQYLPVPGGRFGPPPGNIIAAQNFALCS